MDYLSELINSAVWNKKAPNKPKWNKWIHQDLSENHCAECLKLHECWFEKENTPLWPHHAFCHCVLQDVSYNDVIIFSSSDSHYSKFAPYLFDTNGIYGHGKNKLFNSWGYSVEDSLYLKKEIERQALQKYISGDYVLGKLNKEGQRISITIELPRKDGKGMVTFISGWMVYPNGSIRLTTPYGG